MRWLLRALVAAAVLVVAPAARAETALVHIEGVASKRFGRDVDEALPEGVESEPSRTADAAVKQALRKHPLSKISERPEADHPLVKDVKRAMRAAKRDVAVVITVGKKRDVRVLVVRESDDAPTFFREATLPRFTSAEEHVSWWADLFEEAMKETRKPEPEPPPESVVEEPKPIEKPKEKPKPPPPKEEPTPAYFLSLGPDMSWRLFSDIETNGPTRSYRAFPVFGFHLAMEAYPIASGHIGMDGNFGMSLGAHSKSSDGQTLATTFTRGDFALKARLFTANRTRSPWIALVLGYGFSRFTFDDAPPNREIPTGDYAMFRAGLDARAPIDRIVLSAGAEYDRLLSIAALGNLHAAPSGNGLTARAAVGFEFARDFQLRLEGRYTWLTFGLVRDVPSIAVDQYLTGSLSGELAF